MPGDLYLLCSDGLTSMIDDLIIQEVLSRPLSLSPKVDQLIEGAKMAGGYDNITVILCEVMAS
jgi:protein phosphatase